MYCFVAAVDSFVSVQRLSAVKRRVLCRLVAAVDDFVSVQCLSAVKRRVSYRLVAAVDSFVLVELKKMSNRAASNSVYQFGTRTIFVPTIM